MSDPIPHEVEEYRIDHGDVEPVNTKQSQLKYCGFLYNKKESFKNSTNYRCNKYRTLKCQARIKYNKTSELYTHVGEHNHSSQDDTFTTQVELTESRKSELYEFLKANTQMRSAKSVKDVLNNRLAENEKRNPSKVVKIEDVQMMKRKFYTERIHCMQDLYIRPDIAEKEDGQQFVRWVQGFPNGILVFGSNYQINTLKSVTEMDQLYIDGTFDIAPNGYDQMVTLFVRKQLESEIRPVLFIFLQGKQRGTYWYMWWVVTYLSPELIEVQKLTITADFELAMHQAILDHFQNAQIIGCQFHFLKAIRSWVYKNLDSNNCLRQDYDRMKEMLDDMRRLSGTIYENEEFERQKERLISKWRTLAGSYFSHYLVSTWCGNSDGNARFSPNFWSTTKCNRESYYELMNKKVESFHHQLNNMFNEKPDLKEAIELLKKVDEEYTENCQVSERRHVTQNIQQDGENDVTEKRKRKCSHFQIKRRRTNENSNTGSSNSINHHIQNHSQTQRESNSNIQQYQIHFRL